MAQIARSLLVPCVQELVKNPALVVPDRYIRPDQDSPLISDDTLISQIPVIDMQSLLSGESMDSELAKLDFVCKEWGFFQLVNHGMSTAFLEKLKKEVEGFFNLSMEEKKKYWQHPGDIEGFGQAFVPEKVMGLSPHSDAAALTILRQLNEVEGLQIKKDGKWIPVTPLPDAFIVNIGDTLEIITNGTYPSIEHRAVVNSVQERLSIATAYSLRYDGEVYPASSLISEKTPPLFRRVRIEEYFRSRYARELRGKSQLDSLRIQHSQG
ncbi:protein SRG1 [Citrus sinensis]|nr:protein SRG1 [Citrus sinensis]